MKAYLLGLCLLVPAAAFSQAAKGTLADYLAAHPVPGGLVVGAERANGDGKSLAEFGYKAVKLGSVVAIVPMERVRIGNSAERALPLSELQDSGSKVFHLMSTLTPSQWKLAGETGIGLKDLAGEQPTIFTSLVPHPLRWRRFRLEGRQAKALAEGTVAAADMPRVRLKIETRLAFRVPFAKGENGYTVFDPDDGTRREGEEYWLRNAEGDLNAWSQFGAEVRKREPNAVKKGQLQTAALNTWVSIPPETTLGDALARVGAATGREILADTRVRGHRVAFPNGKARAGDLLDALALGVTGTYRKVGGTYLLVADVAGAGTRRLRFLLERDETMQRLGDQAQGWRDAVARSRLARYARPDANDPLQAADHLPRGVPFSVEALSPAQRAYLDRVLAFDTEGRYRRDQVAVESNLKYRFILPDGTPLGPEGPFGPEASFRPSSEATVPPIPLAAHPEGVTRPLVVTLTSPGEARRAVQAAKAFGFTELWVRTDRREILTAVVSQGLPVRLFVRPWETTEPPSDPDRTLLGESGRAVMDRMANSVGWSHVVRAVQTGNDPPLEPVRVSGDSISPFNPRWPSVQARIIELARTPGLAGIVLADTAPNGYSGLPYWDLLPNYSTVRNELWAFGYDEATRLAFFRANGIDPIDFISDGMGYGFTLYNPFFSHYPIEGAMDLQTVVTRWREFRSQANRSAVVALGRGLPNLPIVTDIRRSSGRQPPLMATSLRGWNPDGELPQYEEASISAKAGDIRLLSAPDLRKREALADFTRDARLLGSRGDLALAVDLTQIPAPRWEEVLGMAFVRK